MNDTEITTDSLQSKPLCWIKFTEQNGKIYAIQNKPIPEKEGFTIVQTDSEVAVTARRKSFRNFSMRWNVLTEQWDIAEKSNSLILRDADYPIHTLDGRDPESSDINVTLYKENSILEVSANVEHIKNSMNLNDIGHIMSSDNVHMNMYITAKNDPDMYLGTIEVDPVMLIDRGSVKYDLEDITKYAEWKNINIHTRKLFSTYSLESFDKIDTRISRIDNRPLQSANPYWGHLQVKYNNNQIIVTSDLEKEQSYLVSNNKALMFMVCDDIIDNIQGVFSVDTQSLIDDTEIRINIDFDWPKSPVLLFKNNKLKVQLIGDTNG